MKRYGAPKAGGGRGSGNVRCTACGKSVLLRHAITGHHRRRCNPDGVDGSARDGGTRWALSSDRQTKGSVHIRHELGGRSHPLIDDHEGLLGHTWKKDT